MISDTLLTPFTTAPVLPTPGSLRMATPVTPALATDIAARRAEIGAARSDPSARLVVVVGPCSIHDPEAALEYADWLRQVTPRFAARLLLLMRVHVEKPRTRDGWKGLVADPGLDGSGRIEDGLRAARRLMGAVNAMGVGVATEFVGAMTPAYLADLVSWAAIGARTVESPVHRELASWLPCPVGFKNSMNGDVQAAVNAVVAAAAPQASVAWDDDGLAVTVHAPGNPDAHIVLRGGGRPNHDAGAVRDAVARLRAEELPPRVMVDCGHGNSGGDALKQLEVARDLAAQIAGGSPSILGVMVESHLRGGAQRLVPGAPLVYGQSITDACLGLDHTLELLDVLDQACAAGQATPWSAGR